MKAAFASLKNIPRFFFAVGRDTLGRDRSYPTFRNLKRVDGIRIVDRDLFIRFNDGATVKALNPFNKITGPRFARLALEDEALKIRVAGRTFTFLDLFRHLGEFLPSFRWLLVVIFFEKIGA
jgi:hypothetical protein